MDTWKIEISSDIGIMKDVKVIEGMEILDYMHYTIDMEEQGDQKLVLLLVIVLSPYPFPTPCPRLIHV